VGVRKYLLFYKPFGVLPQFTDKSGRTTLSDFGPFPKDVYPVGRLDFDSEGLMLLTNDGELNHFMLNPQLGHPRTYLVQVERVPDARALRQLRSGIMIEGRRTRRAQARLLSGEPDLPSRPVPIRYRRTVPTAWLEITLTEGRNRQIRKMTAAVGHPTLRLVRTRIGNLTYAGLKPGGYRALTRDEIRMVEALKRSKVIEL